VKECAKNLRNYSPAPRSLQVILFFSFAQLRFIKANCYSKFNCRRV